MNVIELENSLKLIDVLSTHELDLSKKAIKSVLNLANEFYLCYKREKGKLPYHLNLIDELRASENAHSRILVRLLKYKVNNQFAFLQSFIKFIQQRNKDVFEFEHSLENSEIEITVGKQHIDAFIVGKDFAIIIENKIHNAVDQDKQIERYIKKAKERKIHEDEIYVIYLTRWGGEPSEKSFSIECREAFKKRKRYLELSYRYDIISWLEEFDLSTIKESETFIGSALHQYIDHLKGLFNIRKIHTNMNKELLNTIESQLELTADYQANVGKIHLTLNNLGKTREYLEDALTINWLNVYLEKLKKDYPSYEVKGNLEDVNYYPNVSIVLKYSNNSKEIAFSLLIEKAKGLPKPYFGVGRHYGTETKNSEIENLLSEVLSDFQKSDWWYGYKYVTFESAYGQLKQLLDNVFEKIK